VREKRRIELGGGEGEGRRGEQKRRDQKKRRV
jgi:hypothetical protein